MELTKPAKVTKAKPTMDSYVSLRVKRDTKRRLLMELTKINKKPLGKKVRLDALIMQVMARLTSEDIAALQDASLSNADRLEQQYQIYLKTHPGASKDDFFGELLKQGVPLESRSNVNTSDAATETAPSR